MTLYVAAALSWVVVVSVLALNLVYIRELNVAVTVMALNVVFDVRGLNVAVNVLKLNATIDVSFHIV